MIESEVFRISSGRFATILLQRHGEVWLAGAGVLFVTSLFLGAVVDYRIAVLAVILVCLFAPALMMILYYSYGLKGMNYLNVIDHRVEIGEGSVVVLLRIKEPETDDQLSDDKILSGMKGEGVTRVEEWRRYDFPDGTFGPYAVGKDYVVFPFCNKGEGFLYLPESGFRSRGEFIEAVRMIAKGIYKVKKNENHQG
ncbi:MAG: hypothetical protein K2J70_03055 [Muribaculaceae bacterium]|nr:hypothetical protein [Muribaculaceae bacterium]